MNFESFVVSPGRNVTYKNALHCQKLELALNVYYSVGFDTANISFVVHLMFDNIYGAYVPWKTTL